MTAVAKPVESDGRVDVAGSARARSIRRTVAYVLLIAYAIAMCIPFAWSVSTSFKELPDVYGTGLIPDPVTLDGWRYAWNNLVPPLPVLFLNSAILAAAVTITNLVLGSMAGYAFARIRFPGR